MWNKWNSYALQFECKMVEPIGKQFRKINCIPTVEYRLTKSNKLLIDAKT